MPAFPAEGDTFGAYEIVRRIGRGGMGTVFEARQVGLGRSVALKLLSPELADDPSFRARFEREARTVAGLDSPHVIQVFDAGQHEGLLFIASQLIHGRDLLRLLDESGPLPEDQALRLLAEVAWALADAHQAGILHRDVKPANILVRESSGSLFAYLCDFGIAHEPDSTLTRTSGVLGTLNYMAPECHEGVPASVASDVYSLGCVLWAALSGEAPYRGTSEYQVARAHVEAAVPQLTGGSAGVAAINEILRRSMAKRPQDRYGSAREMGSALVAATAASEHAHESAGTMLRPHSASSEDTRLRVPASPAAGAGTVPHASRSDPAPSTGARASRRGRALAWAGVLAIILVLAGIGFAAARVGDGNSSGATGRSSHPSTAVEPSGTSSGGPSVRCADGTVSPSYKSCRLPRNSEVMREIFPSLDGGCRPDTPNVAAPNEIAPTFRCRYPHFEVRYSTWRRNAVPGRLEYFNLSYGDPDRNAPRARADLRVWEEDDTARSHSKSARMPYLWAAAYSSETGKPYSVIVKAPTKTDLERGIAYVRLSS